MENLYILFIIVLLVMFICILLLASLVIWLFVRKDKLREKEINFNISNNNLKIAENNAKQSSADLENVKLQIQYEETIKMIKERGVSLAEGVAQTFKEIDKGE
jgi:predicted Holliday junction resolvase-like endonuclease